VGLAAFRRMLWTWRPSVARGPVSPRTGRAGFALAPARGRGGALPPDSKSGKALDTGPGPQGRTPDCLVEWLLNGPEGCSWKIAGFRLQVAGFSPFYRSNDEHGN